MAKYLDPKNDLIFKRIFAEHPHLLIDFLNAIMPLSPGRQIETIEYLPTEQVPDIVGKRNSIVDVKCIDNENRQFIVEMQMFWSEAFNDRMVFNAGKAYVRQLNKKEDYNLLHPVYALALINDIFDRKTEQFYHHCEIVNRENTDENINGLEFVLIELPKFKPQRWEDKKLAVLWLRFLNEIDEDTKILPPELAANENILEAAELCEIAAFTPAQLEFYDACWDAIRVERTIGNAFLREGLEKGEKTGTEKTKTEVVIKANKKGLSIEDIADLTGFTIEEISKILK